MQLYFILTLHFAYIFICGIYIRYGPVVQRIGHEFAELKIQVRFLAGSQVF